MTESKLGRNSRLAGWSVGLLTLMVLGLVVIAAWTSRSDDELTVANDGPLRSITWVGSVRADGAIAVRYTLDLDVGEYILNLRVPPGAVFAAVDGQPVALANARYGTINIDGPVTVSYELPGRISRYSDGAVVRLTGVGGEDGLLDNDLAAIGCTRCQIASIGYGDVPVTIVLYADGAADGRVSIAATSARRLVTLPDPATRDDALAVQAINRAEAVPLIAVIPASAVPDVDRSAGTATDAVDALLASSPDDADEFRQVASATATTPAIWPVVITALALAVILLFVRALLPAVRARGEDGAGDGVAPGAEVPRPLNGSRPNDLTPTMVALVSAPEESMVRRVTAAALLGMVERGAISVSGTSRRFTLSVASDAAEQGPIERVVLAQLNQHGATDSSHSATEGRFVGPDLWQTPTPSTLALIRATAYGDGAKLGLVSRLRLIPRVIPLLAAMIVIAFAAFDGLGVFTIAMAVLVVLTAVAVTLLVPPRLTKTGREQAALWRQYAAWQTDAELARASTVDIWNRGADLTYAAATGLARAVVDDLGPYARVPRATHKRSTT